MSLAHLGVGQLLMASLFSGYFSMLNAETTKLRGLRREFIQGAIREAILFCKVSV